ncbi:hypothetical protein LOTGIDRAFT_103944 [Lottia gigantea]|uniref:TM7S3/TM198-like domain-containing protein n=1 Tax=Lottia gigantea TaxID=225164 RepID=V4ARY4_LOTGI|nr:hypothetical protein LOTGIDRAFT_103944 [Lottia gigantea]ESO97620.1 hypothetical protein LOTGIDRAFT_103944 [Lottia gigantea]
MNFLISEILLKEGQITDVSLYDDVTTVVHILDNSVKDINYIVLEIHSQVYNVTVSMVPDFKLYDETVSGRDIGIITKYPKAPAVHWFVNTSSIQVVQSLMLITYIKQNEPIPGGCNQIMNLENDANLLLSYTKYWTAVHYQWSNTAIENDCESSETQKLLEYDVYVYFLKEASLGGEYYKKGIKNMMGKENIMKNGRKLLTMTNDMRTVSNFSMSSINGQGVIYSIIVRQTNFGTSSSYISMVSYGCDLLKQTCDIKIDKSEYVIGALSAIIGLGLCFCGHRFFKTELFIFGFLTFSIIFFLIFSIYTNYINTDVLIPLGCSCGIIGGLLAVLFWWYFGIPVLSVLFVGLVGGYLFSAIIFFTPFGNLSYWHTEFNYWMTFVCGLLLYTLVLLCFTKTLNIVTCAFVGSYLLCLFLDILLKTTLKLILLNNFNKAIIKDYLMVHIVTPFQLNDIILVSTWLILMIVGITVQFKQSKGYPPFPPCPRILRRRRLEQEVNRLRTMEQYNNERTPLISGNDQPPSYTQIASAPQRQELYQPT